MMLMMMLKALIFLVLSSATEFEEKTFARCSCEDGFMKLGYECIKVRQRIVTTTTTNDLLTTTSAKAISVTASDLLPTAMDITTMTITDLSATSAKAISVAASDLLPTAADIITIADLLTETATTTNLNVTMMADLNLTTIADLLQPTLIPSVLNSTTILARKCSTHADCHVLMVCENNTCVESKRGDRVLQVLNRYPVTSYGHNCSVACTYVLICDDRTKKCICPNYMIYDDVGDCVHLHTFNIVPRGNVTILTPRPMVIHGKFCSNITGCDEGLVCDVPLKKCKCASTYRIVGDLCIHENSTVPDIRQKNISHPESRVLARKCSTHADCHVSMSCENHVCVESKREGRINDECHQDIHCHFPYAMCINRTCKCSPSFVYNGEQCESNDIEPPACSPIVRCEGNSICDPSSFRCTCMNGHSFYSNLCLPDGYYLGRCHPLGTCNDNMYNISNVYLMLRCRRLDFRCVFHN